MLSVRIWYMAWKRKVFCLTDELFFDTDCISAFLWVGNESLLAKLYPGRIVIPKQVYNELSYPSPLIQTLKARIDRMTASGDARLEEIPIDSAVYSLYHQLTAAPEPGHRIIGSGEAACIALAKEQDGILASNNRKYLSINCKKEKHWQKEKSSGRICPGSR